MTDVQAAARPPLLEQRAFRMLSITRFLSRVAHNALNFGLLLLIVDETGKAFLSSLLVLALVIPATVAGMAAGTAADIFPKRLLVVTSDLVRAFICVLFVRGSGSLATYYIVAIALSTTSQFATSAEGAIMPAIVPREDLTRANAISQAIGGGAQLLGFAVLTPIVLRLFGSPELLFGICAVLFAVAAVYALFIGNTSGGSRREVVRHREGAWWKAGWHQMRSDPAVMHAAIELTLISTAIVILAGLTPKFIEETLGLPVDVGAVVLMPAAVGILLGLRTANFLSHRVPHAALSTFGFIGFVVNLALLTFVNQEASFLSGYGAFSWLAHVNIGNFDQGGVLAMILVGPLGFAYALVSVAAQTIVNDRVPLILQGRVMATQGAMAAAASSLPVLAAGALSDVAGVTLVMALLAAATGAAAMANVRPRGLVTATAGSAS